MSDTWYKGRAQRNTGRVHRNLRVCLLPEDWERFDKIAAQLSWSRALLASRFVMGYLREDESLERHNVPLGSRVSGLKAYKPEVG